MKPFKTLILGVLLAGLLLCVTGSTSKAADFDSLAAYLALGRAAVNYTSGSLSDNDLTYLTNMAARIAQSQIRSKVSIKKIVMTENTLRYALAGDMIPGQAFLVLWHNIKTKEVKALPVIPPEMIGKPMTNPGPHYYQILDTTLVIHNWPIVDDTINVYYAPMSTRMTAVTDAAGIDEGDDIAVALLTASFVSASRGKVEVAMFWTNWYNAYRASRVGEANAPQD